LPTELPDNRGHQHGADIPCFFAHMIDDRDTVNVKRGGYENNTQAEGDLF